MGQADQDYFLDDHGNVTTDEGLAATLLIRKGQDIPKEMADKYGIGKVAQSEPALAEEAPVQEKAKTPAVNKSKKPTKNKGVK